MSDKKNNQEDYTRVRAVSKFESTAMPESQTIETAVLTKKQKKLVLDEENFKPSKTRTELYNELIKDEKGFTEEDSYEFPNPAVRAVALAIDGIFILALIEIGIALAPLELKVFHYFLEMYNLETMFSNEIILKIFTGSNFLLELFFLVVVPVAFFNCSLGKKITRLRVRGEETYTLSISKSFQRELILKPISILLFVGFIMPFFDKKNKSLHDKVCETFVIKD